LKYCRRVLIKPEFSGIERRLEKLSVCLQKLEPFKAKEKKEIIQDPLYDISQFMDYVKEWMKRRNVGDKAKS